jgi:hypothetical protein
VDVINLWKICSLFNREIGRDLDSALSLRQCGVLWRASSMCCVLLSICARVLFAICLSCVVCSMYVCPVYVGL